MDSDVVLAIALWLVCGFLSGCCLVPVCFHGFYRSCLVPGWFLSFLTGSWIVAVVWVVRWHFERCTQVCTGELDPEAKSIRQFFHHNHTTFAKDFLVCGFDFTVFFFPGSVNWSHLAAIFLMGSNHHVVFVLFRWNNGFLFAPKFALCSKVFVLMFQHDPLLVFQFTQVPGVSTKTKYMSFQVMKNFSVSCDFL